MEGAIYLEDAFPERSTGCPDVIPTSSGDTLFSSSWLYGDRQKRILKATLLRSHGACESAASLAEFLSKGDSTGLPYPPLESCLSQVPTGVFGRKYLQRIRVQAAMFSVVPRSFVKLGVSVLWYAPFGSAFCEEYSRPLHFERFVQLAAGSPATHCFHRFYASS
jgi:hypothetical protein